MRHRYCTDTWKQPNEGSALEHYPLARLLGLRNNRYSSFFIQSRHPLPVDLVSFCNPSLTPTRSKAEPEADLHSLATGTLGTPASGIHFPAVCTDTFRAPCPVASPFRPHHFPSPQGPWVSPALLPRNLLVFLSSNEHDTKLTYGGDVRQEFDSTSIRCLTLPFA